MNRLVLIDGNAIMHRAYHALPPLTTPDGKPTHVVYGFVSMILKIFHDLKPTHMAVTFDRPGPTFRSQLYKEYQIQRPEMEDDFVSQIPMVHETIEAFGIPIFEHDGFEADDMIGTITKQCQMLNDKYQIIIVTGDRDILQLVEDEKVLVFMPTKGLSEGRLYGEKEVVERMGVTPKLIVDLKALVGDPSDNYPGVTGIGPKTAAKLLSTYKTLKGIIKAKKLSASDQESALLSQRLAQIRADAPIDFDEKNAHIKTLDTSSARKVLEDLHFPSLLKRLTGEKKSMPAKEKKEKPDTQQQLFDK
jgi:DNA polymerase-1